MRSVGKGMGERGRSGKGSGEWCGDDGQSPLYFVGDAAASFSAAALALFAFCLSLISICLASAAAAVAAALRASPTSLIWVARAWRVANNSSLCVFAAVAASMLREGDTEKNIRREREQN